MVSGIGDELRSARLRQGSTLADAAATTRVRESHLAALEQEEFEVLGSEVYARGFLRSYARYLGLDPEPLLERYRSAVETADRPAGRGLEQSAPRGGPALPRFGARAAIALIGGLLLLLLLFAGLRADAVSLL